MTLPLPALARDRVRGDLRPGGHYPLWPPEATGGAFKCTSNSKPNWSRYFELPVIVLPRSVARYCTAIEDASSPCPMHHLH
jgi:hypothetical protein